MCMAADGQPEPSAPAQEKCFVCEAAAVSHCQECFDQSTGKLYLCANAACFDGTHGTARIAQKHQKSLRAWNAEAPWTDRCCAAHEGNVLALWCRTCACLVCPLCAQFGGAHEGHTVAQVGKVWRERQEEARAVVGPLGDVLAECNERVRQLTEEEDAVAAGGGAVCAARRALDETVSLLADKAATLRGELDAAAEAWSTQVAAERGQLARHAQSVQALEKRMRAACAEDDAAEAQRVLLTLEELCAQRDALGGVPAASVRLLELRVGPLRQAVDDLHIASTSCAAATGAARPHAASAPTSLGVAHDGQSESNDASPVDKRAEAVREDLAPKDVGPAPAKARPAHHCTRMVFLLVVLLMTLTYGAVATVAVGHDKSAQQKNDDARVWNKTAHVVRDTARPLGVSTASGNASSCDDSDDGSDSIGASDTQAQALRKDSDAQQASTAVPSAEPTSGPDNQPQSAAAADEDEHIVVDATGDEDTAAADGDSGGVSGDEAQKKAGAALLEGAPPATPADGEDYEDWFILLRCFFLLVFLLLLRQHFHSRVGAMCNYIGNVYYRRRKCGAALAWFSKARAIREEKALYSLEVAETYLNIGNVRYHQNQYDDALLWYNKARTICEDKAPNSRELAATYLGIGNVRYHQNQHDSALLWYTRARTIPEGTSLNSLELAEMYSNIGTVYYRQEQYDAARLWYVVACTIREDKAPNSRELAETYTCLARVYEMQNDHGKSADFHLKAQNCLFA